jgi:hypothetical protein
VPKLPRRSFLSAAIAAVASALGCSRKPRPEELQVSIDKFDERDYIDPTRRYAVLQGASMFSLYRGTGIVAPIEIVPHKPDPKILPSPLTAMDRLIPLAPEGDTLCLFDREIGLSPEMLIGTIDELVDDYRRKLEICARAWQAHRPIVEEHDATLAACGITSFTEVASPSKERITARKSAVAAFRERVFGPQTV